MSIANCPWCGREAKLRLARNCFWSVECNGWFESMACVHGITGDHKEPDAAITEWAALVEAKGKK